MYQGRAHSVKRVVRIVINNNNNNNKNEWKNNNNDFFFLFLCPHTLKLYRRTVHAGISSSNRLHRYLSVISLSSPGHPITSQEVLDLCRNYRKRYICRTFKCMTRGDYEIYRQLLIKCLISSYFIFYYNFCACKEPCL